VRACWVRAQEGGGGISQQVVAATLGPAAPELPQGQWHRPFFRERCQGGCLAIAAEPLPLPEPAGGGREGRAHQGMAGGQHWGLWRWRLWLPVGSKGEHCGSSWSLEVGVAAPCGVWRWMLQGLRGGCCSSVWDLKVDTAALGVVWRWTLWLPVWLGGRCLHLPVWLPSPAQHWCAVLAWGQGSRRRRRVRGAT